MPIHLPPITRRQFLKGSFAAAATIALGQGCATRPTNKDEEDVILFSDIHIAADPAKSARDVNMTTNFKTVTAEALALPRLPDTVFINGDLAFNSGETEDYRAVLGLLHPLRAAGLPVHLNMGNHDDREHFWRIIPEMRSVPKNLPGRQASIVNGGPVNWFMLDSLIKTLNTPGRLGEVQLKWLAAALDANPGKPAIIMIHHQPGPLSPNKSGNGLEDENELFAVLRPRRQVKAYIFGHTHRWNVREDESGIHLINLPPTAYIFDAGQPNGWVHANIHSSGARFELRCLDQEHKDHGHVSNLDWRA